jgi:threonine dehydrogenase-like Zn-dependent dehydrogenase
MIESGRVKVKPIISRIASPIDAPEIYNQLCDDPHFPLGTVFDWREM